MPTGSTAVSAVVTAAASVKAILANLGLLVLNGCWWWSPGWQSVNKERLAKLGVAGQFMRPCSQQLKSTRSQLDTTGWQEAETRYGLEQRTDWQEAQVKRA